MLRLAGIVVRSVGKSARAGSAPTSVMKALVSTHSARFGMHLPDVHGTGAAAPAGTLALPAVRAPTHSFSTSTVARNKLTRMLKEWMGVSPKLAAPSAIFVKVGDKGRYMDWATITWDQLKDLRVGGLLDALAISTVFGPDLKDVKISGCSVELCKLPASAAEPSAADEADASKFVELKGAKTVGSMAESTTDEQLYIRVRLPGSARATPAEAATAAALVLKAFNNVLTVPAAPEVLEKHEAAVQIFADRSKAWPVRLAALNEISTALLEHAPPGLSNSISLPLLNTESHLVLLAALVQRAEQLDARLYEHHNGIACRSLLGARGIGKTNVILAFIHACAAAFPDVIPLYVSCAELSKSSSFKTMDLEALMIATARAHGVVVDESEGAFALTEALEKAAGKRGKRMLIAVDEIDELYKVDSSEPALRQHALDSLRYLQGLGNQKSGRYAVLLCGSSASTYSLISQNVDEHLQRKFPLLSSAPHLNDIKFMPLPIPSALCTATAQVEDILTTLGCVPEKEDEDEEGHRVLPPSVGGDVPAVPQTVNALAAVPPQSLGDQPATQPRKSLQLARLLTFFVGTTPRAIALALTPEKDGVLYAERLHRLVTAQLMASRLLSKTPASAAELHARELFVELLRLLQDANSELRSLLRSKDGSANTTAVMRENWEDMVKPLEWEQVQRAWSELAKSKKLPDPNSGSYVTMLVNILCDADLVSLRLDPGTPGNRLWPACAAQLTYSYENTLTAKLLEEAARQLQPLVRAAREIEPLSKFLQPFRGLKPGSI